MIDLNEPDPSRDVFDARGRILRRYNRRGQLVFKACATWREEFLADPGRARRDLLSSYDAYRL